MKTKWLLKKIVSRFGLNNKYHKSYSQCGEDLIIRFIFNNLNSIN